MGTIQGGRRVNKNSPAGNKKFLMLLLPSGRPLRYFRPTVSLVDKPWGLVDEICFEGTDTHSRKWGRTTTYGGKLVENVTQGFARDVMAGGLLRASQAGLNPFMMVHDELVCHVLVDQFDDPLAVLNEAMLKVPSWARGLPLDVEGWVGERYQK